MRISIEEKHSLVARYQAGESVSDICADSGVPKSTFYTWIKPYCDHDRLRSCCQPAGVYQNETETSKVGEEDRDFTKGQLHGFSVASRKAARACQIAWSV